MEEIAGASYVLMGVANSSHISLASPTTGHYSTSGSTHGIEWLLAAQAG
jgi:hypothetical protein